MPSDIVLSWGLSVRGARARVLSRLLLLAGSVEKALACPPGEAAGLVGVEVQEVFPLLDAAPAPGLDEARRRLERSKGRVVAICDAEYPALLRESPDPPPVLFARGRPLGQAPVVALVGSRRATRTGLEAARLVAAGLARAGVVVVSGFAHGIDAAAHAAALEEGGETWGVLGCGVDVAYPAAHERLRGRMLEGGALLSELPPGTAPEPWHFPVRNRIIAGCARVVVVVEAALKSGSLITARCAAEAGRDVAAVPGPVIGEHAAGSNALLKDGAILVRDATDVLRELPDEDLCRLRPGGLPDQGAPGRPPDDPDAARVLLALDAAEPRDADALAAATGLSAARLSGALVLLELEGLAEALPGALFARRRARA
ncbi:MAG TPA: DNA-processing protein DprA [Thermoanaerobaculia bacterium]|nr:DNA-processing protein DprA [Thermoanaerobaculia bacterium]